MLDMLLAQRSSKFTLKLKLTDVDFQRVLPQDPPSGHDEDIHVPYVPCWLKEDVGLHKVVLDSHVSPRITMGPSETPDDRISAFMAF